MDKIRVEYSFQENAINKFLSVKVLDDSWKGINTSYLLAETGESVLNSSAEKISYDCTSLKFLSSSCIGAIVNISEKARENGKQISFKFGDEVLETIMASGIDKTISLEENRGAAAKKKGGKR